MLNILLQGASALLTGRTVMNSQMEMVLQEVVGGARQYKTNILKSGSYHGKAINTENTKPL